jgi:hypothetical protein
MPSSSVLPIKGLRHDSDGKLTADALQTITDGLKSRGIDPTNAEQKKMIMQQLMDLFCQVNKQYQFIMNELAKAVAAGQPLKAEMLDAAMERNTMLRDIIGVFRHMNAIEPFGLGHKTFIEGWQDTAAQAAPAEDKKTKEMLDKLEEGFTADADALAARNYTDLRKRVVESTTEKNKSVSAYLGLYGFMNIVAVGLILYIAAIPQK